MSGNPQDGVREDASLYETDFYEWTRKQAALMREGLANPSALDWEHLLEEIEALGRSEARAVRSHLEIIILHLLKIEFAGPRRAINHRQKEVKAARNSLAGELTPSLHARIPQETPLAYRKAADRLEVQLAYENREVPLPETVLTLGSS